VRVSGNWDSYSAQNLVMQLEKCDPEKRSTCKSDEFIKKWVSDKYLLMTYNNERFNAGMYGKPRFTKEQTLEWLNIDRENQIMRRYLVQTTDLELGDKMVGHEMPD